MLSLQKATSDTILRGPVSVSTTFHRDNKRVHEQPSLGCILHTAYVCSTCVCETITVLCCHGGCHIYPIITFGPASLNTSGELVCRPSPGSLGATRTEFKHRPHVDCKSLQECGAAWRSSCCRSRSLPCHVTPTWPTSGPQGQGQDNGPQPVTSAVTPEGERCRDFGERVVMTGAVC